MIESIPILNELDQQSALLLATVWLTFVESCKLQKKAALDVFRGYFQRIAEGRRDYDLITEEVLC